MRSGRRTRKIRKIRRTLVPAEVTEGTMDKRSSMSLVTTMRKLILFQGEEMYLNQPRATT